MNITNLKELSQIIERETLYINTLLLNHIQRVKLYHLMYRGLAYSSNQLFNLHGSTAISRNGLTILFGDGIGAIGKSTSSFVVGMDSGIYIVDEFSLFDANTGTIFNNPLIPIHIRPDMTKLVGQKGQFEENFGTFVNLQTLGLKTIKNVSLNILVVPHVVKNKAEVRIEKSLYPHENWQIVTHAHKIKFTHPEFDRVGVGGDKGGMVMSIDKFIKENNKDNFDVPEKLVNLPVYDMYVSSPQDVTLLINQI